MKIVRLYNNSTLFKKVSFNVLHLNSVTSGGALPGRRGESEGVVLCGVYQTPLLYNTAAVL